MKPIQKHFGRPAWAVVVGPVTLLICIGASVGVPLVHGQGDFAAPAGYSAPTQRTAAQSGAFAPPALAQPKIATPAFSPPVDRPASSWPAKPVEFDQHVQQANFKDQAVGTENGGAHGVAELIGSTMGSASDMLGNFKDKISQQTEQFLGASDGSVTSESGGGWLGFFKQKAGSPDVPRMLGSLGLVVGGYLALVVLLRTFGGGGSKAIPAEVVDIVGHLPYGPKQQLQLVRLGSKLLLLINGPDGTHPIGEITDPNEVEHLIAQCQSGRRAGSTRPTVSSAALKRQHELAARAEVALGNVAQSPATRPVAQPVNADSLTEVLRRLERATSGHTASFEA